MTIIRRCALAAAALTAVSGAMLTLPAAPAYAGTLTWRVASFQGEGGDCVVDVTVSTQGRGFYGSAVVRQGEIVVSSPYHVEPGGSQTTENHVPAGGTYAVQLDTRNGFVVRSTTVNCGPA